MKISLAAHRYFYYLFFFIMPACSGKKSSLGDDCPSIAPSTTLSDSPSMTPSVSSFPSGSPETPLGGTCEDEEVTQVLTSSDCFQEITAPGLYVLEDDIACDFNDDLGSTNIAFKFTGNDITLNCNGHTISGVNAKETAISGLFLRGQGIVRYLVLDSCCLPSPFQNLFSFVLLVDSLLPSSDGFRMLSIANSLALEMV